MKEIMCKNKTCRYYYLNHCRLDNDLLIIDENNQCYNYVMASDFKKRIKKILHN